MASESCRAAHLLSRPMRRRIRLVLLMVSARTSDLLPGGLAGSLVSVDPKLPGSIDPDVVVLNQFTKLPVQRISGPQAFFSSVVPAINEEGGGRLLESSQDLLPKPPMRVGRIENVVRTQPGAYRIWGHPHLQPVPARST